MCTYVEGGGRGVTGTTIKGGTINKIVTIQFKSFQDINKWLVSEVKYCSQFLNISFRSRDIQVLKIGK